MGFDVYGKSPKNEKGQYFRNNVWWWHPLWEYCLNTHSEITSKVLNGHSNEGDGLDSSDAYKLGILLRQDYHSGFAKDYEQKYANYLKSLPLVSCDVCNGTGFFGHKKEFVATTDQQQDVSDVSGTTGQTEVCRCCEGAGETKSFLTNYPFSAENVKEFSDFCINSGGFSIC
jgi:hypothetical protein